MDIDNDSGWERIDGKVSEQWFEIQRSRLSAVSGPPRRTGAREEMTAKAVYGALAPSALLAREELPAAALVLRLDLRMKGNT